MLVEIRALLRLGLPVFISQLCITSMSFVDTVMAGHYSRNDLAGIAVGSSFWLPAFLFVEGILLAVTPLVAQAHGRQSAPEAGTGLKQGLWLGLWVGMLVGLLLLMLFPVLHRMGVEAAVQAVTRDYLSWLVLSLPVVGIYQALRSFIEGSGRTRPVMVVNILGFFSHIGFNYLFIYGKAGFPAMGGAGCGLSMLCSLALMAAALAMYISGSSLRLVVLSGQYGWPKLFYQLELLRLGLPIGLSMLAEVSVFAIIALLVAPLGAEVVAGHQVALNLSAQAFMLPFSLGMALTIRVGYFMGSGNLHALRHTVKTGLVLALCSACCTSSFMFFGSRFITGIYSPDIEVQAIAVSLLFFSAVFQFPDALQVSSIGILRGCKITRLPMIYTLVAYWVVALPLGYSLGLTSFWGEPLGARGLWMGLVVGLSIAAVLLLGTVVHVMRHSRKYLSDASP